MHKSLLDICKIFHYIFRVAYEIRYNCYKYYNVRLFPLGLNTSLFAFVIIFRFDQLWFLCFLYAQLLCLIQLFGSVSLCCKVSCLFYNNCIVYFIITVFAHLLIFHRLRPLCRMVILLLSLFRLLVLYVC